MTYEDWKARHHDTITAWGPRVAALSTPGARLEWADRWKEERRQRRQAARRFGAQHEFYMPPKGAK